MTKHKLLLGTLLTSGLLLSCNESALLDQVNPNRAVITTFWQSQNDAIQGLNAAYSSMQEPLFARWILFSTDLSSDEGYSQSPWTDLGNISKFIVPDSNLEPIRAPFEWAYKGVYRTNQVIENVPNINMDAALKKRIVAEAKVIRAYFYYHIVNIWGRVPEVTRIQSPNDRPRQMTEAEGFDLIIKDCTEAAADLPESYTGNDLGRFHKYSAIGLMGKAYMQKKQWAQAAATFKQILDVVPTRFDLVPDWRDNFTVTNENNKESIMEVQFAEDPTKSGFPAYNVAGGSEGSERAQFFGLRNVGWCDGQPTKWLYNEFQKEKDKNGNVDPRLDYTLFYQGSKLIHYGKTWDEWATEKGYGPDDRFWVKYTNWNKPKGFVENYFSGINTRVIRLADVMLLYAEALNEQGQTAQAIPFANRVRARSNMADLPLSLTQAAFREQLRHDRVVELAGETVRFFDMKRYGILGPELAGPDAQKNPRPPANISNNDTDFANFVKGKSEYYPLPLYETDANPNIKQNPGW